MKFRPQILTAILAITLLASLVVFLAPDKVEMIVGGAITGIGMLGMKLLENSEGG